MGTLRHLHAERFAQLFVDHVADGHGRQHFEETARVSSVQSPDVCPRREPIPSVLHEHRDGARKKFRTSCKHNALLIIIELVEYIYYFNINIAKYFFVFFLQNWWNYADFGWTDIVDRSQWWIRTSNNSTISNNIFNTYLKTTAAFFELLVKQFYSTYTQLKLFKKFTNKNIYRKIYIIHNPCKQYCTSYFWLNTLIISNF